MNPQKAAVKIGIFSLLLLSSALTALAADPTINNVMYGQKDLVSAGTETTFYTEIPGFTATQTPLKIQYDYNSGLFVFLNGKVTKLSGPVKEEIKFGNQVVYDFDNAGSDSRSSTTINLSWDGTCNVSSALCQPGNTVPDGKYTLSISSTNNNDWNSAITYISGDITVNKTVSDSLILTNPLPPAIYDPTLGDPFFIYYNIDKGNTLEKNVYVYTTIQGPTNTVSLKSTHQVFFNTMTSWDGKINGTNAPEGNYTYTVVIKTPVNGYTYESNELTGNFIVDYANDPSPSPSPNPPAPAPNPPAPSPSPNPPSPSPSPVTCGGFTDVATQDCKYVEYVKSIGVMTGYASGDFGPNNNLNRAEIAKIVEMTFKKFDDSKDYCLGVNPFPDVSPALWAFQYICRGKQLNMITGYLSGPDKGYYRPERAVNRAEFLALLLRNLNKNLVSGSSYVDVGASQWYSSYAKFSYDNKLFNGTYLYPIQSTRRIEVARVLYRLHEIGEI